MKKIFCLILLTFCLVGCTLDKDEITILVPSGIPLVAIGGLIDDDNLRIESVMGPDLLISGMISASHDIIIAPLNVGAKLYLNDSSNYRLASIITWGNTYLVSRISNPLNSISDLMDQDILAYARNSTPDIILKKVLDESEISATITYQNGIDQVIPYFICNPGDPTDVSCNPPKYIMGAEPFISKLEIEYKMELNILDLQEQLDSPNIPQAAIFVKSEGATDENIKETLIKIKNNVEYLNANPQDYANNIVSKHQYFQNLGAIIIENSIPRSNIDYLVAKDNIVICEEFFQMLNDYNPNLLGGKVPDLAFYN